MKNGVPSHTYRYSNAIRDRVRRIRVAARNEPFRVPEIFDEPPPAGITSHRARSTIASQLYSAKEPMSLFELQDWLGHSSPESTKHYAKITPTKLATSYANAGYFKRNIRRVEVLIDQETVRSGIAAQGEPWRFYDLAHGYCAYDFFEQCPHRIACAKCSFHVPKDFSKVAKKVIGNLSAIELATREMILQLDQFRSG